MKFHRVIGKIDPLIVSRAEQALSTIFLELASRPEVKIFGSKLGGDPLLFSLIFPMQHVATTHIATAATDGKRYYWNPHFILSLSLIGVRLVCGHEAWHAIYMHPQRRGPRHPKLYNIAVDFVVNYMVMKDLQHRGFDPTTHFTKHLGNYLTLPQTIEMFANPFAFAIKNGLVLKHVMKETSDKAIDLPHPNEERELTNEEKKIIEEQMKSIRFFYADPNIADDILRPEVIYEMLLKVVPRDPKTGELGIYYPEGKEDGPGYDIFGLGETMDDHMDATESPEGMAKRLSDAIQNAKQMAGNIPSELERELGLLTAPKIKWTDFIRTRMLKARDGNSKNDWSRFRTRPLLCGMLVPKRKTHSVNAGVLLDTSGSMSSDDMSWGLSQLANLDQQAELWIVSADAEIYWDKAIKLKQANREELAKIKPHGGGGTKFAPFFKDYDKHFGKCQFLIVITDGQFDPLDITAMEVPSCPVYWIITSASEFKAPFGKVFSLRD